MTTVMQEALVGVRVIEFGDFVSAPWTARLLADLGADVVKVESPATGDSSRRAGPFAGDVVDPEASGLYLYLNANKRGVTIDLSTPEGRRLALDLVEGADVVVENLGPDGSDRPGLDVGAICDANSRAVVTSVTPFGRSGPRSAWRGGELVAFHSSGVGYETPPLGSNDMEPRKPLKAPGYQALFTAGWLGALASMSALLQRDLTGRGQHVDISEQEAMASHVRQNITRLSYDGEVERRRLLSGLSEATAFGPCKNGWFAGPGIGYTERDWQRLRVLLDDPEWSFDPALATASGRFAQRDRILEHIAAWKLGLTKAELFERVMDAGVVGFPLNEIGDSYSMDHLHDRRAFTRIEHPAAPSLLLPRPPWVVNDGEPEIFRPAPLLGEHTVEVLTDRLGLDADACLGLKQSGTI